MQTRFDFFGVDPLKGLNKILGQLRLIQFTQGLAGSAFSIFFATFTFAIFADWFDYLGLEWVSAFIERWGKVFGKTGVVACLVYPCFTLCSFHAVQVMAAIREELTLRMNTSSQSEKRMNEFAQINVLSARIEEKFQGPYLAQKALLSIISAIAAAILLVFL